MTYATRPTPRQPVRPAWALGHAAANAVLILLVAGVGGAWWFAGRSGSASAQAPVAGARTAALASPVPRAQVRIEAAAWNPGVDVESPTFDGRPLRPARTLRMTVTAYCPGPCCCGKWSRHGLTASGMSVQTNGMALVAADTRLLPFWSLVSVPGYAGAQPVPVLDRGGRIKGHRLDVLFPTHAQAREWGVRTLDVVVWDYADPSR